MRTGACQCGAVAFACAGEPLALYACHCADCRRQSGSAFGLSLVMPRADLSQLRGAPRFWTRGTDSGGTMRCAFCGECGARLWHERSASPLTISVKAGVLDGPVDVATAIHIWTSRRLPGVAIPPGAVSHPGEPPD
jgi:hypothetical protein